MVSKVSAISYFTSLNGHSRIVDFDGWCIKLYHVKTMKITNSRDNPHVPSTINLPSSENKCSEYYPQIVV